MSRNKEQRFNYPTKTKSWLYTLLYPWVAKGVDLFVDKLHVNGLDQVPSDGPVMLIANHQNAMLDPLICCRAFPRQLHWLTRSDVFKNKVVANILHQINMLPIYREKDGLADQMQRNEEVFKVCRERLSKGAAVAMFPEGSHRGKKQLMTPLKKGFARLAFTSVEKDNRLMKLRIIPMGIDYSHFLDYQPRLILKIGTPIAIEDHWSLYLEDPNKAINQLVKLANERLSGLMVDIKDEENYQLLIDLEPLFWNQDSSALDGEFTKYKNWTDQWVSFDDTSKKLYQAYHAMLGNLNISSLQVERYLRLTWRQKIMYYIELFPALLGIVLYSPLYLLAEKFIQKTIKDELFYNSIRLAFFTFLTPIYLGILTGIISLSFPSLSWIDLAIGWFFSISLGLFVISWNRNKRKVRDGKKVSKLAKSSPENWKKLLSLRNEVLAHGKEFL